MKCVIQGCSAVVQNQVSFHNFPQSSQRRAEWKHVCQLKSDVSRNTLICSKHFLPSDFKMHGEVMKLVTPPHLKFLSIRGILLFYLYLVFCLLGHHKILQWSQFKFIQNAVTVLMRRDQRTSNSKKDTLNLSSF